MCTPAKIKRLRFTYEDDLEILRQVLVENPFEEASRWRSVHKNIVQRIGKEFSQRAIKEHVEYLIKLFIKEDRIKLKKSGTEEQYEEKERLLQELVDLKRDFSATAPVNTKAFKTAKEIGLEVPDVAAGVRSEEVYIIQEDGELLISLNMKTEEQPSETLANYEEIANTPSTSSASCSSGVLVASNTHKKRSYETIKSDTLEFIKERNNKEHKLKEKQLQLEDRRIALEERKLLIEERKIVLEEEKLKLEKAERLQRLELDKQERLAHIKTMEQQQQILMILINQLNSNKN